MSVATSATGALLLLLLVIKRKQGIGSFEPFPLDAAIAVVERLVSLDVARTTMAELERRQGRSG